MNHQDPTAPAPLVSVGIPGYNRPTELARAVRSVLDQDLDDLEVVVSDDASPDPECQRVCADLAAADSRVRVTRQPCNLGHAGNYQWVLDAARGRYFMWLSDDDWLDPRYISSCLEALHADPDVVLAYGLARFYEGDRHVIDERPIDLESARPGARVVGYFARVSMNGPLFGLARRTDMASVGFPPVVGGDWQLVAALAARGHIRVLPDVHIHRSFTGIGGDSRGLAEGFGMNGLAARHHHVVVAARMWREIAVRNDAYLELGAGGRCVCATLSALLVLARFPLLGVARNGLRAIGADGVEPTVGSWLRARDEAGDAR